MRDALSEFSIFNFDNIEFPSWHQFSYDFSKIVINSEVSEKLNIHSFNIHFPAIVYQFSRGKNVEEMWRLGINPFVVDIAQENFKIYTILRLSCYKVHSSSPCKYSSPLFYSPQAFQDLNTYNHINISASAVDRNLLTNMMGTSHWVDVSIGRKGKPSPSSHRLWNKDLAQVDPDISTGGNCISFNTDNYYFSDECLVYEKNYFKLFANLRDRNGNTVVNLDFLTSWTLRGPFALFSHLQFIFSGGIEVNSTLRCFMFLLFFTLMCSFQYLIMLSFL
jgi:hypothetical protein